MNGELLLRITDGVIIILPLIDYFWFGRSFQVVALVYLAIIAYHTMTLGQNDWRCV